MEELLTDKMQEEPGDTGQAELEQAEHAEQTDRVAKVELARMIAAIINKRHLNQTDAARLLGVAQPKVSNIINGRLTGFSLERLIQFLNALGRDVQIVVKQRQRTHSKGRLKVCL